MVEYGNPYAYDPVWILAGTGILAFINSCILRRVFRVFDEKAEGGDEERTDMEE